MIIQHAVRRLRSMFGHSMALLEWLQRSQSPLKASASTYAPNFWIEQAILATLSGGNGPAKRHGTLVTIFEVTSQRSICLASTQCCAQVRALTVNVAQPLTRWRSLKRPMTLSAIYLPRCFWHRASQCPFKSTLLILTRHLWKSLTSRCTKSRSLHTSACIANRPTNLMTLVMA